MPYATQQQIQIEAGGDAKLVELTDQEATGALDLTVLADAQAKAEGWIHGFLRRRYAIPVVNLSAEGAATLARLSAAETVYQLRATTPMLSQFDLDRRKERERELEQYRTGELRLDEPVPQKSSAVASAFIETDFRERLKDIL